MQLVYGDLHIHIGSARGKPVKITASPRLNLRSLLYTYATEKGLDMIGVVDAGSPLLLSELETMLAKSELREHHRGGFLAGNGVLLITASEVESAEGVHIIIFLPGLSALKDYQKYMSTRVSNLNLSTQKSRATIEDLINLSVLLDGIIIPAHVFTPHKGIYGFWTDRLCSRLGRNESQIKAIELGLSADTNMADMLAETRRYTFLSNSDAHSPENVGREYNLFRMADKNFQELRCCIEKREGRRVMANYGMDPLLGKYHRSYCPQCSTISQNPPPVFVCSCGSDKMVTGVYDRIAAIRDYEEAHHPAGRPIYHYRVPLKDLPGIGPKTLMKLIKAFGNEINVAEKAAFDDIIKIAGEDVAEMINRMRHSRLDIIPGGGGYYGKVKKDNRGQ